MHYFAAKEMGSSVIENMSKLRQLQEYSLELTSRIYMTLKFFYSHWLSTFKYAMENLRTILLAKNSTYLISDKS